MFRSILYWFKHVFSSRKKISLLITASAVIVVVVVVLVANYLGYLNIFGDSANSGTVQGKVLDAVEETAISGATIRIKVVSEGVGEIKDSNCYVTKDVNGTSATSVLPLSATKGYCPPLKNDISTISGQDGSFKFPNLLPGDHFISVEKAKKILLDDKIFVIQGDNKVELIIDRIPALSSVVFVPSDASEKQAYSFTEFGSLEGNTIPNSFIIVSPLDDTTKKLFEAKEVYQQMETMSDEKGKFIFDKIPVGKYVVNSIFDESNITYKETEISKDRRTIIPDTRTDAQKRDDQRKTDLAKLKTSIDAYSKTKGLPASDGWIATKDFPNSNDSLAETILVAKTIDKIPCDPTNTVKDCASGITYQYWRHDYKKGKATEATLYAKLDSPTDSDKATMNSGHSATNALAKTYGMNYRVEVKTQKVSLLENVSNVIANSSQRPWQSLSNVKQLFASSARTIVANMKSFLIGDYKIALGATQPASGTDQFSVGYQIAEKANSEMGYTEKTDNMVKYNKCYNKSPLSNGSCPTGQGVPWCTVFTSWSVNQVLGETLQKYGIKPGAREWSVIGFMDWFKRNNGKKIVHNGRNITIRWIPQNLLGRGAETPKIGDILFWLGYPYNHSAINHINHPVDYQTINGNWGNKVAPSVEPLRWVTDATRGIGRFDDSLSEPARITGKVGVIRDRVSQPIWGVQVSFTPIFATGDIEAQITFTSSEGNYAFTSQFYPLFVSGRYKVELSKEGYKSIEEQRDVGGGNNTFDFTMEEIATPVTPTTQTAIKGFVTKSVNSTPNGGAADATVQVLDGSRSVGQLNITAYDGSYTINITDNPPKPTYTVKASYLSNSPQTKTASVQAGQITSGINFNFDTSTTGTGGGTTTSTELQIYTKCLSSTTQSPKIVSSFDIHYVKNGVPTVQPVNGDHYVMTPNPNSSIQLKNIKGCIANGTSPDTDTKSSIGATRLDFDVR